MEAGNKFSLILGTLLLALCPMVSFGASALRSVEILEYPHQPNAILEFHGLNELSLSLPGGPRYVCKFSLPAGFAPAKCKKGEFFPVVASQRELQERACLQSRNLGFFSRALPAEYSVNAWINGGLSKSGDYQLAIVQGVPCRVGILNSRKTLRLVGLMGGPNPSLIVEDYKDGLLSFEIRVYENVFSEHASIRSLGIRGASDGPAAVLSQSGILLTHQAEFAAPESHKFCTWMAVERHRRLGFRRKDCVVENGNYSIQGMAIAPTGREFALLLNVVEDAPHGKYAVRTKLYLYEFIRA